MFLCEAQYTHIRSSHFVGYSANHTAQLTMVAMVLAKVLLLNMVIMIAAPTTILPTRQ